MLRTNNKIVKDRVKAYIMDHAGIERLEETFPGVDFSKYENVCACILDICYDEKSGIKYPSRYEQFKDWTQGLPSALDCNYYLVSCVDLIGDILEQTKEERNKYTEADAEELFTKLLFRELDKNYIQHLFIK